MKQNKLLKNFHAAFNGIKKIAPLILFNLIPFLGYLVYSELTNPAPTFQTTPENSNYLYEAENEIFKVRLGDKESGSAKINFENNRGEDISFSFLAKEDSSVSLQTKGRRRIVFNNVDKGINLEYETLGNGLKEWIVIDQSVQRSFFVFEIELDGLKGINNYRDIPAPAFLNEDGDYSFNIQKGYAIDSAGKRTENVYTRFIQVEGRSYIKVDVDPKWLENKERRFPIRIDPTIVYDETSEFANGDFNRNSDSGSGSSPRVEGVNMEQVSDGSAVAIWHLDEVSGTRDDAVGGNNLTDNNTVTSAIGKVGNAAQFESSNSEYLSLSDNPDISVGNIDFSISAWVKPDSIGGNNMIITKYTNTSVRDYQLYINVTPYFEFSIFNSSGTQVGTVEATTFGTVKSGEWYFVYAFHEASSSRIGISVNGIFDYVTASGDPADTAANLQVGARAGTLFWDGLIDELAFRKKLLTQEELNSAQSNRPYSVYTSDVIDLGNDVNEWGDLIWDEYGVSTGNGETVFDDTSLVAQWNFNNTSGTTATNDAGSCGASCNGTLTNFASTSSQDQAAGTGWTANYRRWGAGALNFDGANDEVRVADNSFDAFGTTGTIEGWININHDTSDQHTIFSYSDSASSNYYLSFFVNTDLTLYARVRLANGSTQWTCATTTKIVPNKWQHVAWTHSPSAVKIYINGTEEAINCTEEGGTIAVSTYFDDIGSNAELATIGARRNTIQEDQLNGSIDSLRIYSRALPGDEILANYNSSNINFQTRVGADTSPDDGNWEDWKPATSEEQIESFDSSLTDDLVSYWKLDETSGIRKDSWGLNNLTDNNTVTSQTGIVNNAGDFEETTSEYLSIPDNASLSMADENFSISAWVKLETVTGQRKVVVAKGDTNTSLAQEYLLWYNPSTSRFTFHVSDGTVQTQLTADNFGAASAGVWYHLLAIHNADTDTLSIRVNNGTPNTTSHSGGVQDSTNPFHIGRGFAAASNHYFDGLIDEVGIWRKALTDDEITSLYSSGKPLHSPDGTDLTNLQQSGGIKVSPDGEIKMEGDFSQKLELGTPQVDGNTVALWHLDETNGDNAGVDIFDETANNNDGEFEGSNIATSVIKGVTEKARSFNGSNDYISVADSGDWNFGTESFAIESWVKSSDWGSNTYSFITQYTGSNPQWRFQYNGTNGLSFHQFTSGGTNDIQISQGNTNGWTNGIWHHVAVVRNSASSWNLYLDGMSVATSTTNITMQNIAAPLEIGRQNAGSTYYFNGSMDEIRITKGAGRTAEEIAETYRLGRDHYLNITLPTTDLSGKNALPFWITADKPGTYLEAAVGESAYSNLQPDLNTVAYWKMDENIPDSCNSGSNDVCDISGNSLNGNFGGNTKFISEGIGKSVEFDGTGDNISIENNTALNLSTFTVEAWALFDSYSARNTIIDLGGANNTPRIGTETTSGLIKLYKTNVTTICTSTSAPPLGVWVHIAVTYNGSTCNIYINGKLDVTTNNSQTFSYTSATRYIGYEPAVPEDMDGRIDEVRVSSAVRTASEISQAYESKLRSHPITIDFAAALDASDAVADSDDTSFTIDARGYGLSQRGLMLFNGDKVIVKEKINDTEYIAQGIVDSINPTTGDVTVSDWDSESTFPSSGYTGNANVLKWQREYWPILNNTLPEHMDEITQFTLRITNGSEGRTVWIDDLEFADEYLTDPSGSEITSSLGNRYFQYRSILTSTDPKVSAALTGVEFNYVSQTAPNTPTLDSPADRAKTTLSPQLKTTADDGELDNLQYKIILCENSTMNYKCQTFDQTSSQTGWSGQDAESSTMYASGTQATYTIQTPLEAGGVYYWKSYAIDPNGINEWSSTQTTPRVIYMNSHPRSPSADNYEHFVARRENPQNATSSGWNAITGSANSGTTASTNGWIDSNNLTVGDKYLVMVWGEHNSDSTDATSGLRVKHGSTSFSESESVEKTGNTNTSHKTPYNWFTVWDAVSGEDLEVELYWGGEDGSQARVEDVTLIAINAEELIANGDLEYGISNSSGEMFDSFDSKAEISWTIDDDSDPWWILSYIQPEISNDLVTASIETKLVSDTPTLSTQTITNSSHFVGDTPIYSIGTALTMETGSKSFSVDARELGVTEGSWAYRVPIEISHSGSTLTDTDVLIELDTESLINASKLQNDCDDITFKDSDDSTILDFWIESGCDSSNTQIWVRVPSIPDGGKEIYLYYGDESAINTEESWEGAFTLLNVGSCPASWTPNTDFNTKFPQGAPTYGGTGGSSSHSHAQVSCSSSAAGAGQNTRSGSTNNVSIPGHTHTGLRVDVNSTTNIVPPYLEFVMCKKSELDIPESFIAMFSSSTPSGWTRFSALDNKFPRGETTYGGSGGSSTHTHTTTGGYTTGGGGGGLTVSTLTNFTAAAANHTHTSNSGTTAAADNTPPYLDMIFGQADSQTTSPTGLIAMADAIPPLGWTRFTALDSKFPRGASTYGGTGGTVSHTHSVTITVGSANQTTQADNRANSPTASLSSHTHSCTTTTDSQSNIPPYIETIYIEKKASPTTTLGDEVQAGSRSIVNSAGIMALKLSSFKNLFFASKTGNNPNMTTAAEWVEQLNADPLIQIQNNWLIAGGALVNDNGARVVTRIQDSDINITDDTGGWLKGAGNLLSTNLGDIHTSWTAGLKNVDFDSQTTVTGTANLVDPWLIGFSFEEYTENDGPRPDSPSNSSTNQPIRPQLKTTAIDADNENMKYKIQLCTNALMTTGCQTFDQTATQTGWSGQNANSNTRYQSGSQATYTVQSDLSTNTTYYWRAYAIDETGLNVFSNPGKVFSFTTTLAPTAPTDLQTEGDTDPDDVTDSTPEFSAVHNDPNSDNANFYRIQVNTQSDFAGTMMWNPGKTSMTSTANGARSPDISYSGNSLSTGVTYYWRIKFWDINGAEGAWSDAGQFSLLGLVPVNGCYMEETDDDSAIIIHWNNTSTIEDGYRIQRSVNGGGFSNLVDKAADTTSHTDSTISAGNTYQYRVAAKLGAALGNYCTTTTADVDQGGIQFEGLQLGGIQIN